MSEPRVVQADFANWRPVAGRKVLQLVFEVPIEQTEQIMTMLGVPMPGESKWCAIALLDKAPKERDSVAQLDRARAAEEPIEGAGSNPAGVAKPHRPFNSLPLSQQAGIRCNDKQFQEYMCHEFWNTQVSEADEPYTTHLVKEHLGISSRAELETNDIAAAKWRKLEGDYQAYVTDIMYAGQIK